VRLPRIFGKKRGDRRTGSQTWGSLGEAVFHGALVCAGIVFATLLVSGVAVPEWRINHDFLPTRCRVTATGLVRRTVEDPPGAFVTTWRPALRVRYEAEGRAFESWSPSRGGGSSDRATAEARLAPWSIGTALPGWYDPTDPTTVVLERGYNWWMWLLALLLPGALLGFGGGGLLQTARRWGRSEEAIAASVGISGLLGPPGRRHGNPVSLPGVPACDDLVNSPGTVLRYRLPIESAENWTLVGLGLFSLLWNAVLVILAIGAGLDLAGGRIDWFLLTLLVPFAGIGVAGIVLFVRELFLAAAVGTTQIEISDHPLRPGGRYAVLLAQAGAGLLHDLSLSVEVVEQATYHQGTDTRTESVVVLRQPVREWHALQLDPGSRFEERTTFEIPGDTMHSFATEHNAVRWRLVVRGTPARWPAFMRIFPIVVHPVDPAPARVVTAGTSVPERAR
jgi:hypothetical protein